MDDEANRAEEGLPEGVERFRIIYERAGVGIQQVAPDGRLTEVNESLCRLLGYSREESLQLTFRDITHPEDLPVDIENMRRLFAGEVRSFTREKRYRRKDGSPVWIHLTASAVLGPSGVPTSCISVVQDITDRKRAEEALKAAQRRKDEFLGVLAHELRSPLSAIANATRLLDPARPGDHQRWAKEAIERQVAQLARMIDELLDVSRIVQGKIRLRKERIDVSTIVGRAAETMGGLIEERRHQLDVSIASGPLRLDADPTRLEQVLVNLLTNAAKYTPEGGQIWLAAGRDGDDVVIKVRDTGVGISPDLLPTVFDPFMQSELSLEYSEGGLGIGLPLVKKLVELHGGSIAATSEGPGKGSEFSVRLPVADRIAAGPRATSEGPGSQGERSRILVVDDNQDTVRGLARLLESSGKEVRCAYDGPAAVAAARGFQPDAVLLDIGLTEMDGHDVATQLRREDCCKDMLIIAVSGRDEDRRSTEAGFDHYLTKPVDYTALLSILSGRLET